MTRTEMARCRRPPRAVSFAAALLLGSTLGAPSVRAQEMDAARREAAASDLFERGKAKRAAGDYEAAALLFAASSREAPQAGTLLLLAEAYEHLGKLKSANDTYRRAEELADREKDTALAHAAHTRGAAILPRVAQLEIRIATPLPRGLLFTLNGAEVPDSWLNNPVPLDDGEYRLEAFAPGYDPFTLNLRVVSRQAQPAGPQVVVVTLVASGSVAAAGQVDGGNAASSAAQPERDTGGVDQRQLAWWLGGVGVGAAVVTGVIVLIAQSRYSGASCTDEDNVCRTQEDVDDRSSAIMLANIATATTVVSAVGLGVGLSLYFTADDPEAGTGATIGWTGNF